MAIGITALPCCLDDCRKRPGEWEAHRLIPSEATRQRAGKLWRSEMPFIMALFRLSPCRHPKVSCHHGTGRRHRDCSGDPPRHDRSISLTPRLFAPPMALLHSVRGEQAGACFADPTKLAVRHDRRAQRHKAFDGERARERLPGLPSGLSDFVSGIASLRVQPDEELAGRSGPGKLPGRPSTRGRVAGDAQLLAAAPEAGVAFSRCFGDDEEDGGPLALAACRALARLLAAGACDGRQAGELGDSFVGQGADLGHLGEVRGRTVPGGRLERHLILSKVARDQRRAS